MTVPDVPIALPFELFVDGPPRPKGSVSRNASNRGVRHSVGSKRWQATITDRIVRELARGGRDVDGNVVLLAPVTTAVHVAAEFRLRRPAGNTDPEPIDRGKGDQDKLERCLGDALESGGLLADDAQITRWDTHKRWADPAERDGVQLRVTAAPAGYRHPAFDLRLGYFFENAAGELVNQIPNWSAGAGSNPFGGPAVTGEIPGFRGVPPLDDVIRQMTYATRPLDGTAFVADGQEIQQAIHDAYEKIKARDSLLALREYIDKQMVEGIRNLPGAGGFPIMRGDELDPNPRCALCGIRDDVHTITACAAKVAAWNPTGLDPDAIGVCNESSGDGSE